MTKDVQKELAKLLSIVDPKLIVTFDQKSGAIYVGGERVDQGRIANLKAEAEFFMTSDLWNIINQSVRELAQQAMFVSGDSLEAMKKGRSMLYLLDTQSKIVNTFRTVIPTSVHVPPRQ